jgi:hypothetical protein
MADDVTLPLTGAGDVTLEARLIDKGDGKGLRQVFVLDVAGSGAEDFSPLLRAEDSAHANGHKGMFVLAVRKDTPTSLVDTDGDYIPLIVDASGRLHVVPTGDMADDIATLAGTVAGTEVQVIVNDIPAADSTTDDLAAMPVSGSMALVTDPSSANVPTTVKRRNIACHASGNNAIIPANATKKFRVISLFLMVAADVNAYFADGAAVALLGDSTDKLALAAQLGFALGENWGGWFETSVVNQALNLNLSSGVSCAGVITYLEVS